MTVNLLTSGLALLLTCASFVIYEVMTLHKNLLQGYATRAQIIAATSSAALTFENTDDATEVLTALKADRRITRACIFDDKGNVFAEFPTNAGARPFPASAGKSGFQNNHLEVFCPVVQGERALGTVYIETDLSALTDRYRAYAWLAGTVLAASIFLAYLLSRILQKQISGPILALAATAKTISTHRDFSVRTAKTGADELGVLADGFNQLLGSIEERDRTLSATNESLREEIAERERVEGRLRTSLKEVGELRAALDEHAIVAITDPQGKITFVNDRFCAISKYSREELIGKDHRIINSGYHSKEFIRNLWQTIASGKVWQGEIKNKAKDGAVYWVETTIVPFLNEDRKPRQYVAIRADITERKEAEEKLQSQLARLELLHRITHAIGERQDLASIFQVVIRTLEENLPVDFCCICLYEPVAKTLTVTRVGVRSEALAIELALTERALVQIDQNGLSQCVQGRLVYEPEISELKFPFPERLSRGGLRSLVAAPLLVESKVFGVLIAARWQAHGFSSIECEFLRQLSEHVALAAHQAQLTEALQRAYDDLRQTQQAVMQQERLKALGQMASGIRPSRFTPNPCWRRSRI
jgi:PAS domain S-box-containing protein